jgi:hypothetical protein
MTYRDDTVGFSLRFSNGQRSIFATYEEAEEAARAVWSDAAIGHSGDIVEGGERTLIWPSAKLAENDDGSRACASIVRLHAPEVPR